MRSPTPAFQVVFAALLALGSLVACQALQPVQPTAREALATGYATVELAANTTARLHAAGLIDDGKRLAVKSRLQAALGALDAGKALLQAQDETQAHQVITAAMQAALTILRELQAAEGRAAP